VGCAAADTPHDTMSERNQAHEVGVPPRSLREASEAMPDDRDEAV
jgi:hypothetical protein